MGDYYLYIDYKLSAINRYLINNEITFVTSVYIFSAMVYRWVLSMTILHNTSFVLVM
jgi:hypothetical protein